MNELATTYLGLNLKNPVVASASPLSRTLDGIRRLEDAGASAVVLYSLFEEQITQESQQLDFYLSLGADISPEVGSYFPDMRTYNTGPEEYLNLIERAKRAVDVPIIASLNGVSRGAWTSYARSMQEAGADAVELNVYYVATDPRLTGAEVEQAYVDILLAVRESVDIPVAIKVGPYFSAMANVAHRLVSAGADGLVLFNRFYQPDMDLANLEVVPRVNLSIREELRLPLRWAALLYGRVRADIAITSGVHRHEDVVKAMMAGASVVMIASELLQNGLGRIGSILKDMTHWMQEREYESVAQMRGSMSYAHVAQPAAFERANYMKVLGSYT